jgi:hypothetical protein
MTTVQIIGIAVASLAVLLLIVALIATRRHGDGPADEARPAGGSFLDDAPQDTFSVLGKAEQPVEDITIDPAVERAIAAERAAAAAAPAEAVPERSPQPGGLGLDWGPDLSIRTTGPSGEWEPASSFDDEAEITGELRLDETVSLPAAEADTPPPAEGERDERVATAQPAGPSEGEPADGDAKAEGPGSGSRMVPLSDIIVTTSSKMVDLADPEVRRMLTELVTFEIDQASEFRRQGQSIDAVLQLTEAEKVSRALGMTESAQRIRTMMEEIRTGD